MNLYRLDYMATADRPLEAVKIAGVLALGRRFDQSRRLALDCATAPRKRGGQRPVMVSKIDGRTLRVMPMIVAHPDGRIERVSA